MKKFGDCQRTRFRIVPVELPSDRNPSASLFRAPPAPLYPSHGNLGNIRGNEFRMESTRCVTEILAECRADIFHTSPWAGILSRDKENPEISSHGSLGPRGGRRILSRPKRSSLIPRARKHPFIRSFRCEGGRKKIYSDPSCTLLSQGRNR